MPEESGCTQLEMHLPAAKRLTRNPFHGCSSLVELSKPHADTHSMLQKFLCASSNTSFLLLLQGFMLKRINAIMKASLYQVIIHSQSAIKIIITNQLTLSCNMTTIQAINMIRQHQK
jgi:hypothetical protein